VHKNTFYCPGRQALIARLRASMLTTRFLYFFYIPHSNLYDFFIPLFLPSLAYSLNPEKVTVSAGLITGIALVFVLLGYLFYALFRAEDF